MLLSVSICVAAFFWLLWLLRRDVVSLGLPAAYLYSLLLIHVPGAYAHLVSNGFLLDSDLTASSMRFTVIGVVSFVVGVWLARSSSSGMTIVGAADPYKFCWFCLLGGWFFTYVVAVFLHQIPSLGAAADRGAPIWMLGIALGLRTALRRADLKRVAIFLATLMVYPVLTLLLGGFLGYGAAASVIVLSGLAISTRSYSRVLVGITAITFVGLSIFVVYYQHREAIREQVWGGQPLEQRIKSVTDTFADFQWFDPKNRAHLTALDQRLNQNYFVGLAAQRIEQGQVDYLLGRSVWEGLLSLVPRALWPEKPMTAGSQGIVAEMTGLQLSTTTSFGVGHVMEFYINFGIPGLVIGFLSLGGIIGLLDLKAAVAESQGTLGQGILYFLPALPLLEPNGSLVDLLSGSAAALVAAFGWKLAWRYWSGTKIHAPKMRDGYVRAPA